MHDYDIIIKDGTVIDGTRMPRYRADIGIRGGRIARIGRIKSAQAQRVIDASGQIVAPGFVDLHTHYDAQVFWDPYCSISSWHGVTSVVLGNCGFGFAPVRAEERERAMLTMTRVEAIPYDSMKTGMPWDWVTFPDFLNSLEARPKGINLLPYVPVSPLLTWVMGLEAAKHRKPTAEEHAAISRLLDEAMEAGACGWSAQRFDPKGPACVQRDFDGTPMVSDLMSDETCLVLAQVLGERNEGFIQISITSGDEEADRRHVEELARVSGRPVIFNVVTSVDVRPNVHRRVIAWLERCRNSGIRVYGQGVTSVEGFTFTFADWNLFDDVEVWCEATTGSRSERLGKLSDPVRREALRARPPRLLISDFGEILITSVTQPGLKHLEGLSLAEAAKLENKHLIDVMLDTAVADELRTEFFLPAVNRRTDLMKEVVDYQWVIPGVSDGGAHTKFFTGGKYPTEYLTRLVRELGMQTLEDAHWRLSALPAWCAGFKERGVLREGAPADVLVYDFDKLNVLPAEIVHDLPGGEWRRVQRSEGFNQILVNGEVTFENGKTTGVTSGKLLRHGA